MTPNASDELIVVPTKGWLLIGEGYYQKTAISLDTILGGKDDGETRPINDGYIRKGYKAYKRAGQHCYPGNGMHGQCRTCREGFP